MLRKKFTSPLAAESHYFPHKLVASEAASAGKKVVISSELHKGELSGLTPDQALLCLSNMLNDYCVLIGHPQLLPAADFIQLSISAMKHIRSCGRSNIVYDFVKCLGTMRSDGSDSLLPAKRMPLGLIQHCVNFFSCLSLNKVYAQVLCIIIDRFTQVPTCPGDYSDWLVSMYSLFGTKFVKLFSGPMWRVEETSQDNDSDPKQNRLTSMVITSNVLCESFVLIIIGKDKCTRTL